MGEEGGCILSAGGGGGGGGGAEFSPANSIPIVIFFMFRTNYILPETSDNDCLGNV